MPIFARCDVNPKHKAPFFEVKLLATELYVGHEKRRILRKPVGHLCEDCWNSGEFPPLAKQDPAGRPAARGAAL